VKRMHARLLPGAFLLLGQTIFGHEVRPAYLEIRQIAPIRYTVFWRAPASGGMRLAIYPHFPRECSALGEGGAGRTGDAYAEYGVLDCATPLNGRLITVEGLSSTVTDVLVRYISLAGQTQTGRLTPARPSIVVGAWNGSAVAPTYFRLGVDHILSGADHLAFLVGLLILVNGARPLLGTITAFSVAHSLTLAAVTLRFFAVARPPVEATIALSIAFVAAEIVHRDRGHAGFTTRKPWTIAFVFGLLHGLGFAGALSDVGLPVNSIPAALLFFNCGVEAGQLLFVGLVASAVWLLRRYSVAMPEWSLRLPVYGIGTIATFWVIESITKF
jgi:hypothetical protein